MKKITVGFLIILVTLVSVTPALADADDSACWGQASAVFAQTREMGEHASQQPTPRLGLRNLARFLYEEGLIAEDSMQALGQFVAQDLQLEIKACIP